MELFQYMNETAIPSECGYAYHGMTFDGCFYYFLLPCMCKIIKTDRCYVRTDCFETRREYSSICYDWKERCFWAASARCCNKIFKLNGCMKEIDCISICGCGEANGIIAGISYNCCRDTLLVAFAGGIAEIDKKSEEAELKYKSCPLRITGICCVCPYLIVTGVKDDQQCLVLLGVDGKLLHTEDLPWSWCLKSILFNPCFKDCGSCRFEILANKKGCYPYIRYATINPCEIDFCPCLCNWCVCQNCCQQAPCETGDACSKVMESIAYVEAGLSHILNAEGEKLQKVLATTDDVNEILCVNREINKTLINATHLEHALYAKLSAVLDCCKCDDFCGAGGDGCGKSGGCACAGDGAPAAKPELF